MSEFNIYEVFMVNRRYRPDVINEQLSVPCISPTMMKRFEDIRAWSPIRLGIQLESCRT